MCLETPVDRVAHDVLYVHPTLSQFVEHALLAAKGSNVGAVEFGELGLKRGGTEPPEVGRE